MSDDKVTDANCSINANRPWYKDITKYQWEVLLAGFLGWGMDAFDFLLYQFTIVAIIKEFSLTTMEAGMAASVGMIASALGGVFFGVLADKVGRVHALTISIVTFSVGTMLCGFSTNIWYLMLFRIIVGLGMGGEWPAGAALISETWPKEHRGKAISLMQSAWAVGGMTAALMAGPIIHMWGWRVLYFLGVLPALVIFYVRRKVKEPEIWRQQKVAAQDKPQHTNISKQSSLFSGRMLKTTLLASLFCCVALIANNWFNTWIPTFLGMPLEKGGAGLSIIKSSVYVFPYYIGCFFGYLTFGYFADKIGRRKTFSLFFVIAAIMVPIYLKSAVHAPSLFLLIAPITGFFAMGYFGGFGAILAELFPTNIRSTGQGFCYNVGRGVAAISLTGVGALAANYPIGNVIMFASVLFAVSAILIFTLPETVGKELE